MIPDALLRAARRSRTASAPSAGGSPPPPPLAPASSPAPATTSTADGGDASPLPTTPPPHDDLPLASDLMDDASGGGVGGHADGVSPAIPSVTPAAAAAAAAVPGGGLVGVATPLPRTPPARRAGTPPPSRASAGGSARRVPLARRVAVDGAAAAEKEAMAEAMARLREAAAALDAEDWIAGVHDAARVSAFAAVALRRAIRVPPPTPTAAATSTAITTGTAATHPAPAAGVLAGKACATVATMKLTVKTLAGKTFTVEAEDTETVWAGSKVHALKAKVAEALGNSDADPLGYRLVHSGKVLSANDAALSAVGVNDSGFIVVMPPKKVVAKKMPAPAKAPTAAAAATPATPAAAAPVPASDTPAAAAAPAAAGTAGAGNDLVVGSQYEASVQRLCDMGFAEDQVKLALRAAFNNPVRAVEYLSNGIPASAVEEAASVVPSTVGATPAASGGATANVNSDTSATATRGAPAGESGGAATKATTSPAAEATTGAAAAAPAAAAAAPVAAAADTPFEMFGGGGGGGAAGGGTGQLDFLRRLPQFNLMRRMIHTNQTLLQPLLQQLRQTNPSLFQVINSNQEEFLRLLNEPISESDNMSELMRHLASDEAASMDSGGPAGGVGGALPSNYITVTQGEADQIERLMTLVGPMGVGRDAVVQAWLACEKDEALAANYLLDNAGDLAEAEDGGDGGDGSPPLPPAPTGGAP
ncbi:hypothetical protein MMPV_009517 [Pyropia vietnamensis]